MSREEAGKRDMDLSHLRGATDLLRSALADRLRPRGADYLDLFADDAVVEIPYTANGGDRMSGRDEIAAYMGRLRGVVVLEAMTLKKAYWSTKDDVVLEYEGLVHALTTDRRFAQSYVAVVEIHDGRIKLFREYSNPLPAMQAFER